MLFVDKKKFWHDSVMKEKKAKDTGLDAFKGCLIGGAIGDTLGYSIEFLNIAQIKEIYGEDGIKEYKLCQGKTLISDDTQMTLFTATGLLFGFTRGKLRGIMGAPQSYVAMAYQSWYDMQEQKEQVRRFSWLCDVPEMGENRAPGMTCLSAIGKGANGSTTEPINNSKGCGGVMRVAPVGLYLNRTPLKQDEIAMVDQLAAEVAALTHGHELGYLPAAALAHMINRIVYGECTRGQKLKDIVLESMEYLRKLYPEKSHTEELCKLMQKAIDYSENDREDLENIQELGEGWVAEETLAIAIYCSLKYQKDFSKAICVSVNHSGDSDSTGAVTGNILGACIGYKKIPDKWKKNLECADVILEVAEDLWNDCQMTEYSEAYDEAWVQKYVCHKKCKNLSKGS